jgi:hypothetical protein
MKNNKSKFYKNRAKMLEEKFSAMPIINENEKVTLYYDGEFYINYNRMNSIIVYSLSLESAEKHFKSQ